MNGPDRQSHRRILAEDGVFERDQLGARVNSQLLGQHLAQALVGAQRIGLAPTPVLGRDQTRPKTFSEGVLRHSCLGIVDDLVRLTHSEACLEPAFDDNCPQLVQAYGFRLSPPGVGGLDHRRTPPMVQGLGQKHRWLDRCHRFEAGSVLEMRPVRTR